MCAVSQVAVLRAALSRPGADAGASAESDAPPGRRRVGPLGELVWAIIPAIALALVFFWTWTAMHEEPSAAQPAGPVAPAVAAST
jgi:hypothetical protein